VLKAARWPTGSEPTLIVGHQPTLGLLVAHLLAGQSQSWPIKKSAVWWLRQREGEGEVPVAVQAVIGPDCL
jgi:phosphohistidine phosphatase